MVLCICGSSRICCWNLGLLRPCFVADVVKSFDTVDRGGPDLVLDRFGLPVWFRRGYFPFLEGQTQVSTRDWPG